MYQIILIMKGPDGDWLAFVPVTDEPNELMGSLCVWSGTVFEPSSFIGENELEPGMAIKVSADDYHIMPLSVLLEDLKPYTAGM